MEQHPRRWAMEDPDRVAIVYPSTGREITYGELEARANMAAHYMRARGLGIGDHVALLIENAPVIHELCWAAHNAGLYYTAISWRFREDEIAHIIENCGARLILHTEAQQETVDRLSKRLGVEFVNVSDGSYCAAFPDTPVPNEARGSDMLYSSGSTGMPKGVKQVLPDTSVDGLSKMFSIYSERYGWGPGTTYLMPCPIYHSGPMRFAMAMQHIGAKLIVMEKFEAVESLRLVQDWKVDWAQWVPTMLVRIMKLDAEVRGQFDLSSLCGIIHGAAPIAPEMKRQAIEYFGPILEESYGGTEGNGLTLISSKEWIDHPGSVGRPLLGRIDIMDEAGNRLRPRETGTIWFSGGPTFEYHGQPEQTRQAFDSEGRSTLGDVGFLDEDGYLYLTDRLHNMVISGGANVFPQEAENALVMHDRVADASVFGVPDDDMGEVLHAVVQPLDPNADEGSLESELRDWCRQRLASIKCPRAIEFRSSLPRHDTGKIYVRQLKDEWLRKNGGGATS
jgi:long-chain acyl-CoA synthetase